MEEDDSIETPKKSAPQSSSPNMTLQKAVDLGEYNPDYLSTFPEWQTLTKHVQFQFIKQGLDNRQRQLDIQWASVVNVLDFSKKPYLQETLRNIEAQTRKLRADREELMIEYSKP